MESLYSGQGRRHIELPPGIGKTERTLVYYKNTHLFTRSFIAGSVAWRQNGPEECVPDITVVLLQGEKALARTVTDFFGDYRFESIEADGVFQIQFFQAELFQ